MSTNTIQHAEVASQGVMCADCKLQRMRRLPRVGFVQKKIWPIFGFYPWECPRCREMRMMHARGKRHRRKDESA